MFWLAPKNINSITIKMDYKKLTVNLIVCVFAFFAIYTVSAVPVSVILEDNHDVKNGVVAHEIIAYSDLSNVTVIDYFSGVEVEDIDVNEEQFLGKKWLTVKIPLGDMKKGEKKSITYKILRSEGEAMLGCDVYYLEGERHQLFPEKVTIEVNSSFTFSARNIFISD